MKCVCSVSFYFITFNTISLLFLIKLFNTICNPWDFWPIAEAYPVSKYLPVFILRCHQGLEVNRVVLADDSDVNWRGSAIILTKGEVSR